MDDYTELVHEMAEVYLKAVRDLRTENSKLKSENDSLRQIIQELREASDTYYEGGKTRE